MKLTGRNVVITGASRGLGRALAFELGRRGARLVLVARPSAELDRTVAELCAAGVEAWALGADIGDKHAIVPLAAQAAALAGPVDILVNNASTLGPTPLRPLLDTECEDLERVLDVNVVGPFRLTKALAGAMALRGEGVVVNISSDAAVAAYAGWGSYGASKAALDHLTRIWAEELCEHGVGFLSIDPGEMDTAMHAAALPEADPQSLAPPAQVARHIAAWLEDGAPSGSRLITPSAPLAQEVTS
jgi:NAD(P)-dependent dehydrogenase (short-subunit alcohol dehydrogenase family)